MTVSAALRPLDDAADALRRLDEYRSDQELGSAVEEVAAAVERSLRMLLRADPSAPDDHRMAALSADDFPYDDVLQSLRSRDVLAIDTAGTLHELRAAAERAGRGEARPGDADVGHRAVDHLRRDVRAAGPDLPEEAAPEDTTGDAESEKGPGSDEAPSGEAHAPRVGGRATAVHPPGSGRWMAWLAAAIAFSILIGLAWVVVRGGGREYDEAVAAFRAGRLDSAATAFERLREDRPEDVSTLLYLGRIYRRLGQPDEAAQVLREAAGVAPDDGDVRRELGHLFMDLGQPRSAVTQYERALERQPDRVVNWASLIRALRTAGDPRADELLRDAPPEVEAALGGGGP
jgi:tetratricopeptide (TPR) repeat protein